MKDLGSSCWAIWLKLTAPQNLLVFRELHFHQQLGSLDFFSPKHFLLGQTLFSSISSPLSHRSCSKGRLQSRCWDCFVSAFMPTLLMPLPWLWKWSMGTQPAGTTSAAFSFLELGMYHTKKTLSSMGCATLCGKKQISWQCPFHVCNGSC